MAAIRAGCRAALAFAARLRRAWSIWARPAANGLGWRTLTALLVVLAGSSAGVAAQEGAESTGEAPRAPSPPAEPSAADITRALQRYEHEPTLAELVLAVRGIDALDPELPLRLARRARRAGLLPTLRLAGRRGQGIDLAERVDDLRYSTDDQLTLEASLVWRLDRAAYGSNEVALTREATRRHGQRVSRERLVISAYFERRRLLLERDLLGVSGIEHTLRIDELAAILDALSEGAWSRLCDGRC